MKRKGLMTIVLAACITMTSVFSGCSSKTADTSKDNGKITIKFLHRWPMEPNKSFLDKVVADYEKANPNIKIDMQSVANDSYKEKIKVILGTADAPDVFFSWSGEFMYKFVRENKLYDLTTALNQDGWKDTLMESQLKPFTLDNKTYGTPYSVDGKVFFYNTKIFKDNGLEVPKTWDEFIKVCDTLKSKGITPIAYGNQAPWASAHYIGTLNQKVVAEDVRTKDYNAATGEFTDSGYVEALKKYQQLIPYFNANSNAIKHDQARMNWANGKAAMIYCETQEVGEVQKLQGKDFQWGMFKFPDITDGKGDQSKLTGAPEGFVISANTKHPKEAIAFLKYLTGKEVGLKEVKEIGILNGMKGIYDTTNADAKVIEAANLINSAKDIVYWLDTDLNTKLVNVYLSETQLLTSGETTPEKMMQKIQQTAKVVKNETK
ncbi:MAG: extracellular solute-binding protein [Clostridiaceae bacterium]